MGHVLTQNQHAQILDEEWGPQGSGEDISGCASKRVHVLNINVDYVNVKEVGIKVGQLSSVVGGPIQQPWLIHDFNYVLGQGQRDHILQINWYINHDLSERPSEPTIKKECIQACVSITKETPTRNILWSNATIDTWMQWWSCGSHY
jgi:hypothetical protein